MRRRIIDLIPDDAECYAEVFSGAGWVLFAKDPHPVEVINDANGDLVNLWRVMKWRPAELLERVHSFLYSRQMFLEMREQRPDEKDELERAAWMYFMIQTSFGSDLSRIRSSRFGFWNKSRGDLFLNKSLKQFEPAAKRLRGVFVEHSDFETLIRRYDQKRTIFFCDPPYMGTCGYEYEFTIADHERLADCLRGIDGRFLLTINDTPAVRRLYRGFEMTESMEARAKARASTGRKAAPILIVANYSISATTD